MSVTVIHLYVLAAGRSNHQVIDCKFTKSQFFNKTATVYKSSEAYTKLITHFPTMKCIPGQIEKNAFKASESTSTPTSSSAPSAPSAPAGSLLIW